MAAAFDVCFFKDERNNDEYRTLFTDAGFTVTFEPVLDFDWVNQAELREVLVSSNCDQWDAVIATSSRSLEAMSQVLSEMDTETQQSVKTRWKSKILYAVGNATLSASPIEFSQVHSVESNASELGSLIMSSLSHQKADKTPWRLFFPCSNIRRDTLPQLLRQTNGHLLLEELVVYATKSRCRTPTMSYSPHWWVFFSPSGIDSIFSSNPAAETPSNVKFACIGDTSANALLKYGVQAHAVAAKPNAEFLLAAIQAARDSE